MNDKRYPFADRRFRLSHRKNIAYNAIIYAYVAINSWAVYFFCETIREFIGFPIIFTCMIPLSILDMKKGNNDLTSNIVNSGLYVAICGFFLMPYGPKMIITMCIVEICLLLIWLLISRNKPSSKKRVKK